MQYSSGINRRWLFNLRNFNSCTFSEIEGHGAAGNFDEIGQVELRIGYEMTVSSVCSNNDIDGIKAYVRFICPGQFTIMII